MADTFLRRRQYYYVWNHHVCQQLPQELCFMHCWFLGKVLLSTVQGEPSSRTFIIYVSFVDLFSFTLIMLEAGLLLGKWKGQNQNSFNFVMGYLMRKLGLIWYPLPFNKSSCELWYSFFIDTDVGKDCLYICISEKICVLFRLLKVGALYVSRVIDRHQGWRLITCNWLHGGVFHLLANMLSLLVIGIRLEQEFGFGMYSIKTHTSYCH